MKTIEELQKENDELKAHCFELEAALAHSLCQTSNTGTHPIDKMDWATANKLAHKTLGATPQQSLSEIKAQAIEEAIKTVTWRLVEDDVEDVHMVLVSDLQDYASDLVKSV